jgi:hypothetical protein
VVQKSIVLSLTRKELLAIAIHHGLVTRLGLEVVSYSSVTRCLHETIFVSPSSPANIPESDPQVDDHAYRRLRELLEQA